MCAHSVRSARARKSEGFGFQRLSFRSVPSRFATLKVIENGLQVKEPRSLDSAGLTARTHRYIFSSSAAGPLLTSMGLSKTTTGQPDSGCTACQRMIEICEEMGVLINRLAAAIEKELATDERNIATRSNGHYPGAKMASDSAGEVLWTCGALRRDGVAWRTRRVRTEHGYD